MLQRLALLSAIVLFCSLLGAAPAIAESGLTPSPGQLEFGSVDVHFGGSPRHGIQFSNESLSAVTLTSATVTGADAAQFQIVNDGCSGQTIEPTSSCTLEVEFRPGGPGPKVASLELGDGEGTLEVPLSGVGITGTLSANPSPLVFSPIPYTRSSSHEGEQSETEQTTVLDSPDAGAHIESVSIIGADASSFSIQYGNCEHNLMAPNNTCSTGVRFQPLSPGAKHAQLLITSDAANGSLEIPLEGEGRQGPHFSPSTSQALLGDVLLGASLQQTFTIANTGDYPLFIQQSFLISGTPLMFPVLSDTCSGQIVSPNASCAVTVGFQPTTPGEKSASMLLITNGTPSINVLGIDGVGIQPAVTLPPLSARATAAAPPPPSRAYARVLTLARSARSSISTKKGAIDTGIIARCPAQPGGCRTTSFITANIPTNGAHPAAARSGHSTVLLGSAVIRERGGEQTLVRIPLSRYAIALLTHRHSVRATIETVIRAGSTILAERTRTVTLVGLDTAVRHVESDLDRASR